MLHVYFLSSKTLLHLFLPRARQVSRQRPNRFIVDEVVNELFLCKSLRRDPLCVIYSRLDGAFPATATVLAIFACSVKQLGASILRLLLTNPVTTRFWIEGMYYLSQYISVHYRSLH